MTARTADQILREFGLPPAPPGKNRFYSTCPKCSAGRSKAHQKARCLGITIDNEGVSFGCNHCNWQDGGFYNGGGKRNGANGHAHADFIAIYDYVDEAGELLFQVCRKPDKSFPQRRPNGNGWTWGTAGVRKVLYRLPELIEAIATEHLVLIVEGEKDADNLWRIGVPATCNPGGANKPGQEPKWKPEYSEVLRDADIVIVPDNDDPGRAHAGEIARTSAGMQSGFVFLTSRSTGRTVQKAGT